MASIQTMQQVSTGQVRARRVPPREEGGAERVQITFADVAMFFDLVEWQEISDAVAAAVSAEPSKAVA